MEKQLAMKYTKIKMGSLMTEEKDGSPKTEPFMYTPINRLPELVIPSGSGDHARPVIQLSGDAIKPMTLYFYNDRIVAKSNGEAREIIKFEFV